VTEITSLSKRIHCRLDLMKKYSRDEQRELATWAADCAERVLPFFESAYPGDERPKNAVDLCRRWIQTGSFSMTEIRGASLGAHAAARGAEANSAALYAAGAAGHAVATAHVPQHAYGAAYYAFKAFAAADPANAQASVTREYEWQTRQIPEHLREEMMAGIIIRSNPRGVSITIDRKGDF